MKYIGSIIPIFIVILISGCLSDSDADVSVGFVPLLSGVGPDNGVLGNRQIEFFSNQLSFEKAVAGYNAATPEQIDFTANQVILLDAGQKPTAGYAIRVDSIESIGGGLQLNATEISPGPNCVVATVLTEPYVFVKVVSIARVQNIVLKSEAIDCDAP